MWVNTTATSFSHELEEGEDYVGPDFGNVCLMPGTGGKTLGFWSNKNGQALITSSDVTALNALNLYKPTDGHIHHSALILNGENSNQKLLVKCNRSKICVGCFPHS
jgi:hypothetical protein